MIDEICIFLFLWCIYMCMGVCVVVIIICVYCFVLYGIVNSCGNGDFFYSIFIIGRWVLLLL